jgi:hypothetical protein
MARRLLWLFLGFYFVSVVWAEQNASDPFKAVCADLRAVTFVESDFSEEKKMRLLSHPLESKGTLMFSPKQGVYRVMTTPMHDELLVTRTALVQKDSQGKVQRMAVRSQPAARAFVDVFLSFFSGDEKAWRKTFDVSFSGTENTWRIEFVPHEKSPVARALRNIVLEGSKGILAAMTLTEANGDITRTTYLNQRISHEEAASARFPSDLR